jgi:tRNA (mo5U34)-methyltransferase
MLPSRLDGYSVLDIGAYDGYFSFHAKMRGAARVVASDDFVWRLDNVPARANLTAIRTALECDVEDVECAAERLPEVCFGVQI